MTAGCTDRRWPSPSIWRRASSRRRKTAARPRPTVFIHACMRDRTAVHAWEYTCTLVCQSEADERLLPAVLWTTESVVSLRSTRGCVRAAACRRVPELRRRRGAAVLAARAAVRGGSQLRASGWQCLRRPPGGHLTAAGANAFDREFTFRAVVCACGRAERAPRRHPSTKR